MATTYIEGLDIWVSKDRYRHKIEEMGDRHLRASYAMLSRWRTQRMGYLPQVIAGLNRLEAEISRRRALRGDIPMLSLRSTVVLEAPRKLRLN